MTRPLLAPAKINLYLHVVGRRSDGYHLLDSLVAFADIGDRLEVSAAATLNLAITGPFAKDLAALDPAQNLVWRAATLLARALGREPGALIMLEKNLPVASGIGGGSSDAAAVLKALAKLWGASFDAPALARFGAQLGADVPVCLAGKTSWMGGVGEEIAPAPKLPRAWLVLVNPGKALPTAAVFKARRGPYAAPARFVRAPASAAALAALLKSRGNGLTDAAQELVPEIGAALALLEACPGALIARMSGSGATCFALFAARADAAAAARRLKFQKPGWWVASGRLL